MLNTPQQKYIATLFIITILIFISAYLSISSGLFNMNIWDIIKTILRIDPNPDYDLVIFDFRLPRIVIALLVGIGLGIAGTVVQGITRNGLAEPGILGINAGAGTAIVIFMLIFQFQTAATGWLAIMMMPLFGLAGGLLAAFLIYTFPPAV